MGSSLHNKIYLGRGARRGARAARGALALAVMASLACAWLALHTLK